VPLHPVSPGVAARGRVALVQYSGNVGGSTISGHLIAKGLLAAGWHIDVVFGFRGTAVELFEQIGCSVHTISHNNWLGGGGAVRSVRRFAREIVSARRFVRLFRKLEPTVIYTNSLVSLASVLAAKWLRIPCVWHVRELFDDVGGEMRIPPLGGKSFVRRLLRHVPDHVVAISQAVQENVIGSPAGSRYSIVPNAANREFFLCGDTQAACRGRLHLPCTGSVIGVPGTLRPVKGHLFFLKAAAKLTEEFPECHFAISGDGPDAYRRELEEQSRDSQLQQRVHFVGTVRDMRDFYGACDIVCVPSRSEPFGRVVVEALAAGVPVVASAVGGICEILREGETGLLAPYGDTDGLAHALTRVLADRALRDRLAAAGRAKALQEYGEDTYQTRIGTVVSRVACRARTGRSVPQR